MKKILLKNKFKATLLVLFLLCIYVFISAFSYVNAISSDLSKSIFRLHVIANSDEDYDQELKYKVRDSIIEYMNNLCLNSNSKEETIQIVQNHLSDFKEIAKKTILENGYDYSVNVEIGNFEFPTKAYGDISFPSGFYDALRIKIGKAEGKNWWCVLYPSLCFVDVSSGVVPDSSKQYLEEELSDEDYEIISDNKGLAMNFKFKIIEFFTNNHFVTAKN